MKLKTYFSGTVEAAMELARQELGPETMIVYSRKADKANRHLGEYEVVFAIEEAAEPAVPPAAAPQPSEPSPLPAAGGDQWASLARFSAEVADLKRQMARISGAIGRTGGFRAATPELGEIYSSLVDDGFEHALARDIVDAVQSGPEAQDGATLQQAVTAELAARFATSEPAAEPAGQRRIIALVGPPGVGKTLTLVKLAATLGLAARRSAQILSIDNVRIGAPDQLRTYASILGLPFRFAETTQALSEALDEARSRRVVLIDTPGLSPRDMEEGRALASFLSKSPEIEVHLVLSATAKSADLMRAVERYRGFRPDRLVFTRVDETVSFGSMLNTAIRSSVPLSYLATGQAVPEDLEPATKRRLLGLAPDAAVGVASAA